MRAEEGGNATGLDEADAGGTRSQSEPVQQTEALDASGDAAGSVQNLQVHRLLTALGGRVQFASLVPTGTGDGPMRVATFEAGDPAADAFVARSDREGRACYYSLNIVRDGLTKKATKADIVAARGVHVDMDPPADGSPFDRAAALALLRGLPIPPSYIVNSGNGLQPVWLFDRPVHNLDLVEGINRQLIKLTGGDACFNIDRLLRVPGSINTPTAKKAAAGRVPVPAEFVA